MSRPLLTAVGTTTLWLASGCGGRPSNLDPHRIGPPVFMCCALEVLAFPDGPHQIYVDGRLAATGSYVDIELPSETRTVQVRIVSADGTQERDLTVTMNSDSPTRVRVDLTKPAEVAPSPTPP